MNVFKKLIYAVVAIGVLVGNTAAQAAGDIVIAAPQEAPKSAPEGGYFIENVPVKQNPMDYSDINQSPIRGRGRISVVHNEPSAEALEFLKSCKPGTTRLLVDRNDNWHCPQ